MTEIGWRTVTVEQRAALSLSDGCLCVTAGEEVREIPHEQIGTLLITSQQASVTSALLTESIERGIRVVCFPRDRKDRAVRDGRESDLGPRSEDRGVSENGIVRLSAA